jgi:hypothetical protein
MKFGSGVLRRSKPPRRCMSPCCRPMDGHSCMTPHLSLCYHEKLPWRRHEVQRWRRRDGHCDGGVRSLEWPGRHAAGAAVAPAHHRALYALADPAHAMLRLMLVLLLDDRDATDGPHACYDTTDANAPFRWQWRLPVEPCYPVAWGWDDQWQRRVAEDMVDDHDGRRLEDMLPDLEFM